MASRKPTASPEGLSEQQLSARTEAASFFLRGQSNSDLGNPALAPSDFSRAVSLDSHFTPAWLGIALASRATSNWDGAILAAAEVERLEPELVVPHRILLAECHLFRAKQYGSNRCLQDTVIEDLRAVVKLDPIRDAECRPMFAEALFTRGVFRATHNGTRELAVADFAEGLAQFPEDIRFRRERCRLLLDAHDYPLALEDLDLLGAVEPENVDWIWQRADALRGLKRIPEALKTVDELLIRRADHIPSLDVRSRIRVDVGRFDLALTDLNRILELDPASERYLLRRCDLHCLSADLESAEADITSALKPNENRVPLLLKRAAIRERAGTNALALADLDLLLKLELWNIGGLKARSLVHTRLENYDLAEVDAKRRLQRDTSEADGHWILGAISLAKGERESAHKSFRSACRRSTDLRYRVAKEWMDFTMGKKGAVRPVYERHREEWANDFMMLLTIEMLDSRIPEEQSAGAPATGMESSASGVGKSKKKSRGNGEGDMTV